ncbi:glycosyltransferase [Carboxylicivirga marina]|uniref:glycosyltransferase n=1 Tax=Carboxylicivirga marina TaxID=2800988 RepID=UPI00259648C2|nr:glycosyltransferase [uncultured Carboxylicivirga sp.]
MNILIVAPSSPEYRSVNLYTTQLFSCLKHLAEDGEKVDLISFGEEVDGGLCTFDKYVLDDYQEAVSTINKYDACILQFHPDGFGGADGDFILSLVSQVQIPLLSIFHFVSSEPQEREKRITNYLANKSMAVLAFSQLAIEFLEHYYKVSRDKIFRTDYGVSMFEPLSLIEREKAIGVNSEKVIMACGDMCPSSGFETIINALPSIQKTYSNVGLIIVNTSTPDSNTREYKKVLKRLSAQRGVKNQLTIIDYENVGGDIGQLFNSADAYVSSNINDKKLEDAFLSIAVGGGAAVISTPSWYAKELLDDQKGSLFAFKSISELSSELLQVLRNNSEVQLFRANASLYGAQNSWSVLIKRVREIINSSSSSFDVEVKESLFYPADMPELNLQQLLSLRANAGFIEESLFGVPDFKSGYTLRGNAMALQVFAKVNKFKHDQQHVCVIQQLLGLIKLMRKDDGGWGSSLSYEGQVIGVGQEIDLAYAVWSLGVVYSSCKEEGIKDVAYSMMLQLFNENDFNSNDASALVLLGVCEVLKNDQSNSDLIDRLRGALANLKKQFPTDAYQGWQWHEKEIQSQVGLVLLGMLSAYELLQEDEILSIVKRAMRFIERFLFVDTRFLPTAIGRSREQSIEVKDAIQESADTYLITKVYAKLFALTSNTRYAKLAFSAHSWYLGDNTLGRSLFDINSGGCYKALSKRSVEPVMSTTSTSAYWLSYFALYDVYSEQVLKEL